MPITYILRRTVVPCVVIAAALGCGQQRSEPAAVTAVSPHFPGQPGHATLPTPQPNAPAFSVEESRNYENWNRSVVKSCTALAVMGETAASLPLIDFGGISHLNSPGILRGPRDEFALMGEPELAAEPLRSVLSLKQGAKLTVVQADGTCTVYLNDRILTSTRVARAIPILVHYSPVIEERQPAIKIRAAKIKEPTTTITSVPADFLIAPAARNLTPGESTPAFVASALGISVSMARQLFPLRTPDQSVHAILPIDSLGAVSFNLRDPFLRGPKESLLPFFQDGRFDRSMIWLFQIPRSYWPEQSGETIAWVVSQKVLFEGSLREGGKSTLLSLQLREGRASDPAGAARCLLDRANALENIKPRTAQDPFRASYLESAGPCLPMSENLAEAVVQVPQGRILIGRMFSGFEAGPKVSYLGWEGFFAESLYATHRSGLDSVQEFGQPDGFTVIGQATRTLRQFSREARTRPEIEKFGREWAALAAQWALRRRNVSDAAVDQLLAKLSGSPQFEETNRRLLLDLARDPAPLLSSTHE